MFNLRPGPAGAGLPERCPATAASRCPNGVFARLLPDEQNLSHVDAYNLTLQRELHRTDLRRDRLRRQHAADGFIGDGPAANCNQPTIVGFGTLSQDQRKPFFACGVRPRRSLGRASAATSAGRRASTTSATPGRAATTRCRPSSPSASRGGYSLLTHYTLQSHKNNDADYFFIDPDLNYGPADFIRTHVFVLAGTAELPFGKGSVPVDASKARTGSWAAGRSTSPPP